MARHRLTADRAFDQLVHHANVKLRVTADSVTKFGRLPAAPQPGS